jgi:uncharacterized protein (TIGR02996 family)
MPDLPAILDAIRERPDDGARWLAMASWLRDNGRDDEAVAVRSSWPAPRDNAVEAGVSLDETLRKVEFDERMQGGGPEQLAFKGQQRVDGGPISLPVGCLGIRPCRSPTPTGHPPRWPPPRPPRPARLPVSGAAGASAG